MCLVKALQSHDAVPSRFRRLLARPLFTIRLQSKPTDMVDTLSEIILIVDENIKSVSAEPNSGRHFMIGRLPSVWETPAN